MTRVRISFEGLTITGELGATVAATDLVSRLPLRLSFEDLSGLEKIGHLEPDLAVDGMPEGDDPVPRDIGWYAPWGNVVLYYGDVAYYSGIYRIGRMDDDVDLSALADLSDGATATVEIV